MKSKKAKKKKMKKMEQELMLRMIQDDLSEDGVSSREGSIHSQQDSDRVSPARRKPTPLEETPL